MYKAIFFDKDGVLSVDKDVYANTYDFELYQFAGDTIAYLRSLNFYIFIVTNQAIVARGLISEKDLNDSFKIFTLQLLKQNQEAQIDDIYYCPHHPNADVEKYRKNCKCRKPKPGNAETGGKGISC